jgi:hypothetical protein
MSSPTPRRWILVSVEFTTGLKYSCVQKKPKSVDENLSARPILFT